MYSIAIIGDIHDWHSQQIESHLIKKKCKVVKMNYDQLHALFNKKKKIFINPELKNIDGMWVRFINNGLLEEITTKLTFLHLLEEKGVYIHNSAQVIEKTVDKVRTTGLLDINHIHSPETIVKIGKLENFKLKKDYLLKPIFGSQGKNIVFLKKSSELKKIKAIGNVFYLQEFIGDPSKKVFSDIRVLVSNHIPISIMKRSSNQFLTNAYQGASTEKIRLKKEIDVISRKVSKLFKLGYGGIDIKFFQKKYYVLEVNSIPSWKAIQKIEKKNISEILVNDFLKNVKRCRLKS